MKLGCSGYAMSPFFVAALVILGATLIIYFMKVDLEKADKIIEEGKLTKEALEDEGERIALQNRLLFAATQAAYDILNPKKTDPNNDPLRDDASLEAALKENILKNMGLDKTSASAEIEWRNMKDKGFIARIILPQTGGNKNSKPAVVEKFINIRVFLLRELLSDTGSVDDGIKSRLAYRMGYGIWCPLKDRCKYIKAENLISCDWSSFSVNENPPLFMSDIDLVNAAIVDRVLEVERDLVDGRITGLSELKKNSVAVGIDLRDITKSSASTSVSFLEDKSTCCKRDIRTDSKGNKVDYGCAVYDRDYSVQTVFSGRIALNVLFVDYAGLKETPTRIYPPQDQSTLISVGNLISSLNRGQSTKNYMTAYEVCTLSPIMLSDGSVKALEKRKTVEVDYRITLKYRSECRVPQSQRNGLTVSGPFINYYYSKDSLSFSGSVPACTSKSSGVYGSCKLGYSSNLNCGCGS